jgi:magnesium chelatase subunit D
MSYPFAALVGQDRLKTALLLNAVNPSIGGVLIRGEKGTAKSTAARGLAELLPQIDKISACPFNCLPEAPLDICPVCNREAHPAAESAPTPFVTLPLGATEDRVLGTLDFERALHDKARAFQPGLLAHAHRGILYVDEVNLLPDHLVDVLLDAAAMGVNTVQREGISASHPARFILVGTMNLEEGELRPQLLDRFGLMVDIAGPTDVRVRTEVVRRRIAFEADPKAFNTQWREQQTELRTQIQATCERLPAVKISDDLLTLISQLCCEFKVGGLRADITMHKTARTLAAWAGREEVASVDVRMAAEMVLPHRRRRQPFDRPELDQNKLDELIEHSRPDETQPPSAPSQDDGKADSKPPPEEQDAEGETPAQERVFSPTPEGPTRGFDVAPPRLTFKGLAGRRNHAPKQEQGRYTRAVPEENPAHLAVDATLRAAVRRAGEQDEVQITRSDLHQKVYSGRTGTRILFVVDASGSMAARKRMGAVKGAVLSLLMDAYQQRDEVGVVAFRGTRSDTLLAPTRSVELAERALRELPTGGRTPLAHALVMASDILRPRDRNGPLPLLVLLSDGRANIALSPGEDPWEQAAQAARELAGQEIPSLVVDTEEGFVRIGRARELAQFLHAEYLSLQELSAERLAFTVKQNLGRMRK